MSRESIQAMSVDQLQELASWISNRNAYNRSCGRAANGNDLHVLYMVEDELTERQEG